MAKPFDRVIVMDPCALGGPALCDLADTAGIADNPGILVTSIPALHRALLCCRDERVLVITEFKGHGDTMAEGLMMLKSLRRMQMSGRLRVMVCTDLDDPVMLRVIAGCCPSVLSLRRDALAMLTHAMRMAGGGAVIYFTPGVRRRLNDGRGVCLTPRQLEWLLTQLDGMNTHASSQAMGVCNKTVYSWRGTLTRKMGGQRAWLRFLCRVQQSVLHHGVRLPG